MHQIALTLLACFCSFLNVSAQTYDWARSIGSGTSDYTRDMAVMPGGDVVISGEFSGTVDFDPGPGTSNITAMGSQDAFLVRFDKFGDLVWAISFQGADFAVIRGVGFDSSGNVFCAGTFAGTVDFDPGPGVTSISPQGGNPADSFVLKLDPGGNLLWVETTEGTGEDAVQDLVVDHDGNVILTGFFRGTVDFDPGPGSTVLTGTTRDIFVQKLDPSGNLIWAVANVEANPQNMGDGQGNAIAVDQNNNVFLNGEVAGEVDFDPGPGQLVLSVPFGFHLFTQKLDANGNLEWAHAYPVNGFCRSQAIAVDAQGAMYSTGIYSGDFDIDPGAATQTLTSNGGWDIFLQRLDAQGNLSWGLSYGGVDDDYGRSLAINQQGEVLITGDFENTVDFDPGAGVDNLTANGRDAFVQKLDAAGMHVWVYPITGSNSQLGQEVGYVPNSIYLAGNFRSTADLDPLNGTNNVTSAGNEDVYLIRLNGLPTGLNEQLGDLHSPTVYPVPAHNFLTIRKPAAAQMLSFELLDLGGRKLISGETMQAETELDLNGLARGIYLLNWRTEAARGAIKIAH
jgi:hypothetical protein